MNLIQLRKRAMYDVVEDYLATVPPATIASMPNFDVYLENFTSRVSKIRTYSASQTTNRVGYSREKQTLKSVMVTRAINVASRIRAYARNIQNQVLESEMDQRISYLAKRPDSVCADIGSFIHNKGVSLLGDLGSYGVSEGMLVDLQKSIDQFTDAIPKPKEAIDNRVFSTKSLAVLFAECDFYLKTMDILVDMLRFSDVDFYDNYIQRRKIGKPGFRKVDFAGDVTDSNGNPLEKVTVKIGDTGIVKETTDKGRFEVKNLPNGIYSVGFSKAGYIDTVVQVAVTKNQRTEFTVAMEAQSGVIEDVA